MDTARRVLYAYRPQVETSGTAGRPRFLVPRDYFEYLVENRSIYTVPQIAEMIGVPLERCIGVWQSLAYPYRRSMPKLQMST